MRSINEPKYIIVKTFLLILKTINSLLSLTKNENITRLKELKRKSQTWINKEREYKLSFTKSTTITTSYYDVTLFSLKILFSSLIFIANTLLLTAVFIKIIQHAIAGMTNQNLLFELILASIASIFMINMIRVFWLWQKLHWEDFENNRLFNKFLKLFLSSMLPALIYIAFKPYSGVI